MGIFMNISENILCALIGVFGTVVGTIIGLVIPYLLNNIGKKRLTVSNIDAKFDTIRKLDGEGGFLGGSWLYFTIIIINKKNKNLILEEMSCELYNGNTLIQTFSCLDKIATKKSLKEIQMMKLFIKMYYQNQAYSKTCTFLLAVT